MARLTAKARKKLPAAKFAGKNRTYPDDTKARAVVAKGRATQQVDKGNLSPFTAAAIKSKANKVITKGKSKQGL